MKLGTAGAKLGTTLVLMIVFMLLGSLAFFDPFRWDQKAQDRADAEERVWALKGARPTAITIRRGKEEVRLLCADTGGCPIDGSASWKMAAPVEDRGDSSTITTLLNGAVNLSSLEKIDFETPIDPKEFGLGEGKPALEITTKDRTFSLETGGPTAVGPNIYLRDLAHPQRLYVVAAYFPKMLEKEVFHWRNKRLFPDSNSEGVTAISWRSKDRGNFNGRKEKGAWRLESPVRAPANFVMMEGLASTLVYAEARSVLAAAPKLGAPSLAIEFTGGKLNLYPAPGGKDLVASVGGKFFLVDSTPFRRFQKDTLEYRERRLFPALGAIGEMELVFPRESKRIKLKKGAGWGVSGGDAPTEEISQDRLQRFADALSKGEALSFLPAMSPAGEQLRKRVPDLELILPGLEPQRFLVVDRKMVVTQWQGSKEVLVFGDPLLPTLPIRLQDLYASSNKLAPEIKKEDDGNHDSHGHQHAH